jgi:hypothetical protein
MSTVLGGAEIEREELNWLLTSGVLGRSHNLAQMLTYICEKHFEGKASQITEHAVAVEALGRREDFNPQLDTIVRVTVHSLRKRLQEVYQGDGARRPVHILIPAGQYAPSFVRRETSADAAPLATAGNNAQLTEWRNAVGRLDRRWLWVAVGVVLVALTFGGMAVLRAKRPETRAAAAAPALVKAAGPVSGHAVRALLGNGRKPYVDHSGFAWSPGNYCSGGSSVTEPNQKIAGTEDAAIFLGGIRGNAHCVFPVDPGVYELHLLFAENSDVEEAKSWAVYSLNGGENNTLDVVDDAGGHNIATTKVFRGVRPENDGAIHIDFTSEIFLLKAVEILPTPSEGMLPVRVVASAKSYQDPEGQTWLSDRYAIGGRLGQTPPQGVSSEATGVYASHRVGNFRYILPVIPGERYRVRLYFQEPWFGTHNVGIGGPHSRVFDVWCNGTTLLKDFDILGEAGSNPVVKTFENVKATAQGKIEIVFVPETNYPLIDAIEVVPETNP